MDLQNLIQTLGNFIYEIALWPLLLLITLFKFAFQPKNTYQYVYAELDKPAHERYAKYLSPMLYWLLVSVLPTFLIFPFMLGKTNASITKDFLKQPVGLRLIEIMIFLTWLPLTCSVGSLLRQGTEFNREALRRPFYIYCMLLAPYAPAMVFSFLGMLANDVDKAAHPFTYSSTLGLISGATMFLWVGSFLGIQFRLAKIEGAASSLLGTAVPVVTFIVGIVFFFLYEEFALLVYSTFK